MKACFPKGFLKPEVFPFLIKNNSQSQPFKPQIRAVNPLVCCCCNSSIQPPEPQIKAVPQPPEPQIKAENATKSPEPQIKAVPQPSMFPCAFFGCPPRKRLRGRKSGESFRGQFGVIPDLFFAKNGV